MANDPPGLATVERREFIAVATSRYADPLLSTLPRVKTETQTMAAWLCGTDLDDARRFEHVHTLLSDNPTLETIREVFAAEQTPDWRASTAAFIFVTGHGHVDKAGTHWTILTDATTAKPHSRALRTADLAGWLMENGPDHVILVLDTCFAGRAASGIAALPTALPRTWLVLPSATQEEEAQTCALTDAIHSVLAELHKDEGEKYGLDPYLKVEVFVGAIREKLGDLQSVDPIGGHLYGPHICLPNPHYRPSPTAPAQSARRDLALLQADVEAHWGPRSRGVANAADAGWLFTGRADLMRRLIDAATSPTPGVLLVTGGAGSGKSAVLARLVTLSDPDFRAAYANDVARIPDDLTPPDGAVDVAVLATGKNATEILAQICRATGALPGNGAAPALPESRQAWTDWIIDRRDPVTIVVDALDEAANPTEVLTGCLQHLRLGDAANKVRLLVGVRCTGDGVGTTGTVGTSRTPRRPVERQLADVVQDGLTVDPDRDRVQVDAEPWWVPGDVSDYVTNLLLAPDASPYRRDEAATQDVAEYLASAVRRSFLVARLAAEQLARRPDVVDANDPAWRATIADGVLGVFRDDLHQRLGTPQERLKAVHLLRAVAFAYGRGLPWRTIWPLVANAVADDPNYPDEAATYGDSDIAWLLNDTGLAGYLVTDREDDITVYRLFHDNLRTTLREHWRELLDSEPT